MTSRIVSIGARRRRELLRRASERAINVSDVTLLQLDPAVPVRTPEGDGFAHILAQEGSEGDIYWTVVLSHNDQIRTYHCDLIQGLDAPRAAHPEAA